MVNLVLFLMLGISAFTDLRSQKIYNAVTLPGVVIGLALNSWLYGLPGFKDSLLGLAVGFFSLLIVFYLGAMGGGDIKLLAAVGAIKGFPFILYAVLYSIFAGGIIALFVMAKHGILLRSFKNVFARMFRFAVPGLKVAPLDKEDSYTVPYGVAIAAGTVWALVLY